VGLLDSLFNRQPKPGRPVEVTDDTFEALVLRSSIPAVVDFSSNRCGPCQVMAGLLNELGPDFVGRVAIFKLNVDDNWETARKYDVRSVPTLLLFSKGEVIDDFVGLVPLNPLRARLEEFARGR
jgi:thioredoxin 1